MILETLENMQQYEGMHAGIDRILKLYPQYTCENFVAGKVDVDGDAAYMVFAEYETQPVEGAKFEAHRKYIDVMYMVDGCETIYVKNTDTLTNITDEYDSEADCLLGKADQNVTKVHLQTGDVVVLFPQDAHLPGRIADASCKVKKIIGKVRVDG